MSRRFCIAALVVALLCTACDSVSYKPGDTHPDDILSEQLCTACGALWYKPDATHVDFYLASEECLGIGISAPQGLGSLQAVLLYNSCMEGKGWCQTSSSSSTSAAIPYCVAYASCPAEGPEPQLKELSDVLERVGSTADFGFETPTDVNQKNFAGETPLHVVSFWGNAEAVEVLIEAGADVNARGEEDRTPIFLAIEAGSPDTVKLLLHAGADPLLTENYSGRTALQFAQSLEANPDLNLQAKDVELTAKLKQIVELIETATKRQ